MVGTLASLLGLAVLDSLNPSALAVTIFLLLGERPYAAKVLAYVSAVFASYFGIGVLVMLGLGSLWEHVEGPAVYAVQGGAGALLLCYALLAPDKPRQRAGERSPRARGLGGVFLLGVTITVVEFSTAFPYLGALAILTGADLGAAGWLPILLVYNVVFVAPPLLLMALYGAFGAGVRGRLERLRGRLEGGSREALFWISGIVGFFLLADSLVYFDFFGLVDVPRGG